MSALLAEADIRVMHLMSALGQAQTHAPQQTASLFDHLVGADQNGIRDRQRSNFAVRTLTISSWVVGSSMGRSPGLGTL